MAEEARQEFKVIGTRPVRHDGVDKVTGRAKYGADYAFPDMLHGKILRSPHAHAIIKSIKTERALALPGVKAVLTGDEIPELPDKAEPIGEVPTNLRHTANNCLARGKVLYNGHAVAAVAATSPHIAEEATNLIEVEYEVLAPVLDVYQAMAPNAPILHPERRSKESPDKPSNITSHVQFKGGDLDSGFKQADHIIERQFETKMVHQGYIEPHNALGIYSPDGHATVYTSTQSPFETRQLTALLAGMSEGDLKVVPAEIGGGFGGKLVVYMEPLALLLSKKTGHPVKFVMSRAEVLRATGPTSGSSMKVKIGATKDGKLAAAEVWLAYEAGAYPGSPVGAGAMTAISCYEVPNFLVDGYDVVVNKPKTAAYRAPGATNVAFAVETVLDELAERCGMDPIDFRIKNGVKQGSARAFGPPYKRIGFVETCQAIKDSPHYKSKLEGPFRGRGVAFGVWFHAGGQSSAVVNVHNDGTASVMTGSVDIGGSRASMAMIAAEVLGLDPAKVRPMVADTDSIGYTAMTGGSRTTHSTGVAVFEAAQDAVRQLKDRAARLWQIKPEDVDFVDGKLVSRNNGVPPMTIKELAAKFGRTGGPVSGQAGVSARGGVGTFAGCCVDVEVDPETGKVQILRATVAQDAGRAIHPSYVEGQMQGGTVQGIGWALNEEYVYDEKGNLKNAGFLDYRMPTCLDLPLIETRIVEVPGPDNPLGIRGVGEVSIVPPPAAVANAVYRAIGVRINGLPMSPPNVLKAIKRR
ncbi:MAG TPA: xanthine dehydrogenase family protein molybdopterin-binding subunit [Candidatus Binataceae bacterium]|nr:xanthine dehydrogenase family protein molybdopterin-binding subunit [Candidatus Binataceae bacterium]